MDKLQWGSRKRLRCVKAKSAADKNNSSSPSSFVDSARRTDGVVLVKKKITSRYADKNNYDNNASLPPFPSPNRTNRFVGPKKLLNQPWQCLLSAVVYDRDFGTSRANANSVSQTVTSALSPEKEDRYYTTRGSSSVVSFDDHSKILFCGDAKDEKKKLVWPKLVITLSSKEKEEDFMAMKGCKPPQRPKKRAKLIQKTLLLVSPGTWLSDLCQERYEVREKTTSKKKPRGLKAMVSMESDSE